MTSLPRNGVGVCVCVWGGGGEDREGGTETDRQIDGDRQTDRQTSETQTDRQTETEREFVGPGRSKCLKHHYGGLLCQKVKLVIISLLFLVCRQVHVSKAR